MIEASASTGGSGRMLQVRASRLVTRSIGGRSTVSSVHVGASRSERTPLILSNETDATVGSMVADSRWDRVTTAVETTATLAQSPAFEEQIVRLCRAYVHDILGVLRHDDTPMLVTAVQLNRDGKKSPGIALFLRDRALLLWSTGFVRVKTHVGEILYDKVVDVHAVGSDGLDIDAGTRWSIGDLEGAAPILRDLLEAALRQDFRCEVDSGGEITTLEFTKIGLTVEFGDEAK